MLGPWLTVLLLALESTEVIGLRVAKLARGGVDAEREAQMLVNEKIAAAFDVGARLMCAETANHVIDSVREQVAANARRLSTERR
jgi:hypothetical protein